MSDKIQSFHLARAAYVYIRQSTQHQVRDHQESYLLQRRQVDTARYLGFSRVEVIEDDMGVSASGSCDRTGFRRLLEAVKQGEVGCVMAFEVTRLARNNTDWSVLLELCSYTKTLVMDNDDVYDPSSAGDRLLLGIKGTVSSFEIHVMQARAQSAINQKASRGKVVTNPPIGYVRTDAERFAITGDESIRSALHRVFHLYRRLGSVMQVVRTLWKENILLPVYERRDGVTRVRRRKPKTSHVYALLKNPTYAGIYAYGRRQSQHVLQGGRVRTVRNMRVPIEQWRYVHYDNHEGYITPAEYEETQRQLEKNRPINRGGKTGPTRAGAALLSGLLRNRQDRRALFVRYFGPGRTHKYCTMIDKDEVERSGKPFSFPGDRIDRAVVEQVLDAIAPTGVQSSLEAWESWVADQTQRLKTLTVQLEKAQYEERLAHRRYENADPENRHVVRELEQKWDHALQTVSEAEDCLVEQQQSELCLAKSERQRLYRLGRDLRQLWEHPCITIEWKKQLIRSVLHEILVEIDKSAATLVFTFHWCGGVHTTITMPHVTPAQAKRVRAEKLKQTVTELALVCSDKSIASFLNLNRMLSAMGNTWNSEQVRQFRSSNKIQRCPPYEQRCHITLEEAAKLLEMSLRAVKRLIKRGDINARQPLGHGPYIVQKQAVIAYATNLKNDNADARKSTGRQLEMFDKRQSASDSAIE